MRWSVACNNHFGFYKDVAKLKRAKVNKNVSGHLTSQLIYSQITAKMVRQRDVHKNHIYAIKGVRAH